MTDNELLTEIRNELQRTNSWLRILALPGLQALLSGVLRKDEERRVYQASDGSPVRTVAEVARVSPQTVSNYWTAWRPFNILAETETKGRFRKIYDLSEVSLERARDGNTTNGA